MIVLDVEIKKAILTKGQERIEGIEYCEGWRDFQGMGIACCCTLDTESGLCRTFTDDNIEELGAYLEGRYTGGFNTIQFDLPLLAHHGHVCAGEHFDALATIWKHMGRRDYGWSLDSICEATFQQKKSGHGALAPVWCQQGKIGKVIDYCLRDVYLEAKLIQHMLRGEPIRNTAGGFMQWQPLRETA